MIYAVKSETLPGNSPSVDAQYLRSPSKAIIDELTASSTHNIRHNPNLSREARTTSLRKKLIQPLQKIIQLLSKLQKKLGKHLGLQILIHNRTNMRRVPLRYLAYVRSIEMSAVDDVVSEAMSVFGIGGGFGGGGLGNFFGEEFFGVLAEEDVYLVEVVPEVFGGA